MSFTFVEGNAACGPGKYRLTSLAIGLSAPGASSLQVRGLLEPLVSFT